jgi:D-2-hydroxyacid dehydrogenase (NADP+)
MKNHSRRSFIKGAVISGTALSFMPVSTLASKSTSPGSIYLQPPDMPINLYFADEVPDEIKKTIREISDKVNILENLSGPDYKKAVKEANAWFGYIGQEDFKNAGNLKWIQCPSAGVEQYMYDELIKSNVILTNAKGCYAPAIAEHVFGLLFNLTRKIGNQSRNMLKGNWVVENEMYEMKKMTMGIIGFGGIGRQIARRAKSMDMRVIAVDIEPFYMEKLGDQCEEIFLMQEGGLDKLLEQSDVVVSAVPHTKKSEGMMGAIQFEHMKKGSWFINVSRGKIVQTSALVNALKSGQLAGAGLDVTDPEPLPSDHELWSLPNVIITSHISGRSQHSFNRMTEVFTENVKRFISGYPMLNEVNKEAGY